MLHDLVICPQRLKSSSGFSLLHISPIICHAMLILQSLRFGFVLRCEPCFPFQGFIVAFCITERGLCSSYPILELFAFLNLQLSSSPGFYLKPHIIVALRDGACLALRDGACRLHLGERVRSICASAGYRGSIRGSWIMGFLACIDLVRFMRLSRFGLGLALVSMRLLTVLR